ncbi:mitochondrial carrier protein [Lithospermum erythrorhizon]|uniref:Mitochondrial carrier protein n=1 Tax=Lithospermum erythrorhizon TaxID=34254 RepID=A0AAV3PTH5_LITER
MLNLGHWLQNLEVPENDSLFLNSFDISGVTGGLFLESSSPSSFISLIFSKKSDFSDVGSLNNSLTIGGGGGSMGRRRRRGRRVGLRFGSVRVSIDEGREDERDREREGFTKCIGFIGEESDKTTLYEEVESRVEKKLKSEAVNTAMHLWAGAVAAMVSRTVIAPLERLKLEYIVRREQKGLSDLIKTISASEGLKGFWKGNFVNILRTAPFKSINFYAYDTYRKHLLKISGNEETTNIERFVAGAAAGITATILCIPMDTIRTVMVAPGGEAFGGIIGTFRHMIQTEGFFSLYKGLVPSIISMAPSGAVYYGVYDILKSAYLHSPEGKKRLQYMKQQVEELNALEQLELGTARTLIYGAIAGACAEAATYPFEVVRRQLQMQVPATKMSALATCVKIVDHGGVPALYAGLTPSLLQVLPSAAISYFVYELMKILLKVE